MWKLCLSVGLGLLSMAAGLRASAARPAASGPALAAPAPSRAATLAALHRCFLQRVRHHHRATAANSNAADGTATAPPNLEAPPAAYDPSPLGPSAELFFFDQLAASEKELGGRARLLWCRPWFSGPYLRAHGTLSHRSRVARSAERPPEALGSHPAHRRHHYSHHNDATRVLRASAHAGGQHPQADQARRTLEALEEHGGGPTHVDADWLAVTTLVPELYLFEAPHAHAYTPATGTEPTLPQAERARLRFVEHVRGVVAQAQRAQLEGDHAATLLQLGVASHALQDLVTHRGMTEAEHAALTFNWRRNPDFGIPPEREAEARGALAALFARVWPEGPATQVRWRSGEAHAPRTYGLRLLVAHAYADAVELDFAALARRWELAYTYAPRGRNAHDDGQLAAAQAGRWDVAATLAAIWREEAGEL